MFLKTWKTIVHTIDTESKAATGKLLSISTRFQGYRVRRPAWGQMCCEKDSVLKNNGTNVLSAGPVVRVPVNTSNHQQSTSLKNETCQSFSNTKRVPTCVSFALTVTAQFFGGFWAVGLQNEMLDTSSLEPTPNHQHCTVRKNKYNTSNSEWIYLTAG